MLQFSLEHLGLAARDPLTLKDWYVRALGAQPVFDNGQSPPAYLLEMPGGMLLEIYPAGSVLPQTRDNTLAGWRHLALRVTSIEQARDTLVKAGIALSEPIKPAGGGGRVLFFADPEGNLLHLVERTGASFGAGTSALTWAPAPTRQRFRAIIFDMDGVIVDSEPLHERAFREVFQELGYGDTHGMDFAAYYGRSDEALWRDFLAKHKPALCLSELLARKRARFLELLKAEQPLFAGLPELVEKLAARYFLAVASGSPHPVIDGVLEMGNLRRFFPVVVSAEDVAREKPAPDIFLRAAALLNVVPADACVIEDSAAGVRAAKAAGMSVIAITNTLSAGQLTGATRVVHTYAEIAVLLDDSLES